MKQYLTSKKVFVGALLLALMLLGAAAYAANPPICPHVIGWNNNITTWAQGAPWIKVIYSSDIAPARAAGAKIFYRPYEADSVNHDDGCLPAGQTGTQFADLVWARLSSITPKPEVIAYRNEFNWDNPTAAKRTCAEFVNYYNRLKALGYTGKVVFGSFGVGWVESATWDDPDVQAATAVCDGIETHEYFDLTVNCCAPWLCFRHRDIAIANHSELADKEWWIGEFGSDHVCGNCTDCDDDQCRVGWQDRNKLTAQQMIDQCAIYRAGCANQVKAVFLFQQGAGSWAQFEVLGTPVADWMKTTWTSTSVGTLTGNVKSGGANLSGVTVSLSNSGGSANTDTNGNYTITNVPTGSYTATASKSGYNSAANNVTISTGQTTTSNFTLTANTGTISGNVKNSSAQNISGATVSTNTGGYTTTTDASGNYTLSYVAVGTYNVSASKSGYNTGTNNNVSVTGGNTTTSNFTLTTSGGGSLVTQDFETMPSWSSTYDASWGNAATWSIVSGGQAGNFLQVNRTAGGSSVKALVYTVPTNTNITISGYIKCPSYASSYWMEFGYKFGNNAASDFDTNGATWTMIKKFANDGTNGNGNTWTQYTATVNTGSNTQITIGYKLGGNGAGPTVGWDSFKIDGGSSCTPPAITTQPVSQTKSVGQSVTFTVAASGTAPLSYQWKKNGTNISGAVSTSYTISSVIAGDAGNYTCYVSNSCGNVTSNTATLTVTGSTIASQDFESVPSWNSSFDAAWGSAASWTAVSGGQSGNFLQASRASQGSSSKVLVYTVPANTTVTVSIYLKCPSGSCSYWMETACKLGNNSAQDFDGNSATWTYIKKFADTGINGNGNVWTQYSVSMATGSNTQLSVGFKHGASGCSGPVTGWDTLRIN